MGLYERLIGRTDTGIAIEEGKLAIHAFEAILGEVARGQLTLAQARDTVNSITSPSLSPAEEAEAMTLFGTITGTADAKIKRGIEIDHVLLLAEHGAVGYTTPSQVKTRLGV